MHSGLPVLWGYPLKGDVVGVSLAAVSAECMQAREQISYDDSMILIYHIQGPVKA